uniref:Uncharacterized protein n=1 Tax=Tanacetum cinerariifolium TaxID=118510 RepID=A0A6L2NW86_TANCI|nr:hypothetical protein [Tanacetum cinerariifolium]
MSRYYPSKDKENITKRRSQVRDLDSGEKFKISTLGEIVSLEKSNKNVISLRSLLVTKGTPRYLTGKAPTLKGITLKILLCSPILTLPKRFEINHKMTNIVPALPTDPPNTLDGSSYGGFVGVRAALLMSPKQDETTEHLLYAGWMAGPYRCKDATWGRNDDPVTSARRSNGLIQMVDASRCTLDLKSPERETASSSTSENGEIEITATIDGRVKYVTEASIRRHLKLEDSEGPILQSDPTISQPSISSPSKVPTPPHYSPLPGGNTPGSKEGRMTLNELTVLCTLLSKKVESLESDLKQIKMTYGAAYSKLIMKGRTIAQIDEDERITLVQMGAQTQGRNEHEVESDFDFTTAEDISTANVPVTTAGAKISIASLKDKTAKTFDDSDGITLTETLIEIRRSATKPQKVKGVAFRDVEETPRLIKSTTTLQPLLSIDPKDKCNGVLVEEEPVKVKRRDQGLAQIESDAELAQRLYEEELAEVDKAKKERQKQEEAIVAVLTKEFDEIQARMDADHELAARLTYEEQEHFTIKEKEKLLAGFFERRKKQLAAESQQQVESSKKRQREVSDEKSSKKQKLEENNDAEKEELGDIFDIVPRDDIAINVESLDTKYPIVD